MSGIPRRLGRLARGFVEKNVDEERLRETVRVGRERGGNLKEALGSAWRSAAEEWRVAAEERIAEERRAAAHRASARRSGARDYVPRKYSPEVIDAYHTLGLGAGSPLEEANRKRRELVKRHHPDRFVDPDQRARAERVTAEINAAHDVVERYLLRK